MAGVFGNPVTDETLEGLPRYEGKEIGPVDRAREALNLKIAEGKDVKALDYANQIKENTGASSGTLCLVYNATGGTVEYADHKDWNGLLGSAAYPIMIQNGQWGAFYHHQPSSGSDTVGAVVYRGTNAQNKDCDWMLAWRLHQSSTRDNRAYTEVNGANYFNGKWEQVQKSLDASDFQSKNELNGCSSFVSIGKHTYSIFTAILTLQNANKDN